MVTVGGNHHDFGGQRLVGAGQQAEHVGAADPFQLGGAVDLEPALQREALHRALGGRSLHIGKAHGRTGEDRGGGGIIDAGAHLQAGAIAQRLAIGAKQHAARQTGARCEFFPRQARRFLQGAHGDQANGAGLQRGDALGGAGQVGGDFAVHAIGRARQYHGIFALQIKAGEIIDALRFVLQAIADEYHFTADAFRAGEIAGGQHQADTIFERERLARPGFHHRRLAFAGEAAFGEVHALEPRSLIAGRLQAKAGKMLGDIIGSNLVPLRADAAAFQQIIGQEGDMGAERRGQRIGFWSGSGCGDERQGGGQEERVLDHWRCVSGRLNLCKLQD